MPACVACIASVGFVELVGFVGFVGFVGESVAAVVGESPAPVVGVFVGVGVVATVPPWATLAAFEVATAACALSIADCRGADLPDEPLSDVCGLSATIHTAKNTTVPISKAMNGRDTCGHHHHDRLVDPRS